MHRWRTVLEVKRRQRKPYTPHACLQACVPQQRHRGDPWRIHEARRNLTSSGWRIAAVCRVLPAVTWLPAVWRVLCAAVRRGLAVGLLAVALLAILLLTILLLTVGRVASSVTPLRGTCVAALRGVPRGGACPRTQHEHVSTTEARSKETTREFELDHGVTQHRWHGTLRQSLHLRIEPSWRRQCSTCQPSPSPAEACSRRSAACRRACYRTDRPGWHRRSSRTGGPDRSSGLGRSSARLHLAGRSLQQKEHLTLNGPHAACPAPG